MSEESADAGRALRREVPRSAHAEWSAPAGRTDPVAVLEQQGETAGSRAAARSGTDGWRSRRSRSSGARRRSWRWTCRRTPSRASGCRRAVTRTSTNFGKFASPERKLVFDINDFDETVPGPWEWDVKRLCASLHVVARQRGFARKQCDRVVLEAARDLPRATRAVRDLAHPRSLVRADRDQAGHRPLPDEVPGEREARRQTGTPQGSPAGGQQAHEDGRRAPSVRRVAAADRPPGGHRARHGRRHGPGRELPVDALRGPALHVRPVPPRRRCPQGRGGRKRRHAVLDRAVRGSRRSRDRPHRAAGQGGPAVGARALRRRVRRSVTAAGAWWSGST